MLEERLNGKRRPVVDELPHSAALNRPTSHPHHGGGLERLLAFSSDCAHARTQSEPGVDRRAVAVQSTSLALLHALGH
jgi:hypothetical protein